MPALFSSPRCLEYRSPGHPERPERVSRTLQHLASLGYRAEEPSPAPVESILKVHSREHLEQARSGNFSDPDTPYFKNIYDIALLAAGGALAAERKALEGVPAFSLMRPPGHHAGNKRFGIGGFCYLNNIAIAVADALDRGLRVAILDIDVHHGNGTEDIFAGDERVLFISLHQFPLYPGTGADSFSNCRNYPLESRTDEKEYLKTLELALDQAGKFKPDLLAVSAGFDTYKDCPLASLALEQESYLKIGRRIAEFHKKRFAVFEGGYSQALPQCVGNFLEGFFS